MKVRGASSLPWSHYPSHACCEAVAYNCLLPAVVSVKESQAESGLDLHAALKTIARLTKMLDRAAAFEADLRYLLG